MAYGLSTEYGPTCNNTLFVTGQGSSRLPTFGAVMAKARVNVIDSYDHGLVLKNPYDNKSSSHNEDGFVNDMALGADSRNGVVVDRFTQLAQQHEHTLYATGEKLVLHKCTWVMILWALTENVTTMEEYETDPRRRCTDTAPEQLTLIQSKTRCTVNIPHINPLHSYRTLRVWIVVYRKQREKLTIIQKHVNIGGWKKLKIAHCKNTTNS